MDDESSDFMNNKKLWVAISVIVASIVIYLYQNAIAQDEPRNQIARSSRIQSTQEFSRYMQVEQERAKTAKSKKSLCLNISKDYLKDFDCFYQVIASLVALNYEIHLIFRINDNESPDSYSNAFEPLIMNSLVKKHVSYKRY